MTTRCAFRVALENYLTCFPDREGRLDPLLRFLTGVGSDDELYDRHNPAGHLTVSGMVFDPSGERMLLVHHRRLGLWVQPGGHVEATDRSLLDAACREVTEETGLGLGQFDLLGTWDTLFFDVDCHRIPAVPARDEGEHFHFDVRFLMRLHDAAARVVVRPDESCAFRWCPLGELPDEFRPARLAARLPYYTVPLTPPCP